MGDESIMATYFEFVFLSQKGFRAITVMQCVAVTLLTIKLLLLDISWMYKAPPPKTDGAGPT